ncbi:hypothetical protein [Vineibacter terrae]|uniref:hypothetical protein n=1 Tax=Vineibacter terrae TaxID=2586908 RepID=UPI002E322EDA|nr:hypothetical protein [Vineibacter terrae]HEX2890711.1 hypothetical protein [Vineibacter terrae]
MARYTRETLRAELERRGCRQHPQKYVVPFGEMWIHPDGVTRIAIPWPGKDGTYPEGVVSDLMERHDIPDPKPNN